MTNGLFFPWPVLESDFDDVDGDFACAASTSLKFYTLGYHEHKESSHYLSSKWNVPGFLY